MAIRGNPNGHGPHGYFRKGSSKRRVQWASSNERDDAEETEEFIEKNRARQIAEAKKQAEEQEKQHKLQDLDKQISQIEYAISNHRLDSYTLKDYEIQLNRLKKKKKSLE